MWDGRRLRGAVGGDALRATELVVHLENGEGGKLRKRKREKRKSEVVQCRIGLEALKRQMHTRDRDRACVITLGCPGASLN